MITIPQADWRAWTVRGTLAKTAIIRCPNPKCRRDIYLTPYEISEAGVVLSVVTCLHCGARHEITLGGWPFEIDITG